MKVLLNKFYKIENNSTQILNNISAHIFDTIFLDQMKNDLFRSLFLMKTDFVSFTFAYTSASFNVKKDEVLTEAENG